MRINNSGDLMVNGTTSYGKVTVAGSVADSFNFASNSIANQADHMRFLNAGTTVGSISRNGGSATSYLTSSDYRLKKNVTPMTGALNTVALGAQTTIVSVIGNDADGVLLQSLFDAQHIDTSYLLTHDSRITTNKTRVMSRNQQMMRLDAEITTPISSDIENELLQKFTACLDAKKPDVVIFEDYDKGVLTPTFIKAAISICTERNIVMSVDPKKNNFLAYKGVTLFKPNLKEVKEGLQVSISDVTLENLRSVHAALQTHLAHQISLITLSERLPPAGW
jgi:bifunctional ADP-heptose synthase (sugar kinase/adenylyltransferase)